MTSSKARKNESETPVRDVPAAVSVRGAAARATVKSRAKASRMAARNHYDNVAHALVRTTSALKRLTTQRIKEEFAITGIQAEILMLLAAEPAMLGNDLAAVVGVNASTVSHALDVMETLGLLTRRRCTDDRRVVRIALTDQARRVARRTIEISQHILGALTTGISKSDLQALQRGLKRMADNCQTHARLPQRSRDARPARTP
jgi:DNA-binding MarR family transcriptional regulator